MHFVETGLRAEFKQLYIERASHSDGKLDALKSSISKRKDVTEFESVTIFTAGSYARREASKYSDVDLFFISEKSKSHYGDEYNVPIIRLMSSVVAIGDELGFPKFSNDGQFLRLMHLDDMLSHLGGNTDDYENYFTTRLLLILESDPIYNDKVYNKVVGDIISAYFRDYYTHESNFRPNFLMNDIIRFWKTLCLNYENKRNQPVDNHDLKIKQKIKNYKLKFSRMMTCYASLAYLCSIDTPITEDRVHEMVRMTPTNRFRMIAEFCEISNEMINRILEKYHWFLESTNVSEADLRLYFEDEEKRKEAFEKANDFGDSLFEIMKEIDDKRDVFRYLVV